MVLNGKTFLQSCKNAAFWKKKSFSLTSPTLAILTWSVFRICTESQASKEMFLSYVAQHTEVACSYVRLCPPYEIVSPRNCILPSFYFHQYFKQHAYTTGKDIFVCFPEKDSASLGCRNWGFFTSAVCLCHREEETACPKSWQTNRDKSI